MSSIDNIHDRGRILPSMFRGVGVWTYEGTYSTDSEEGIHIHNIRPISTILEEYLRRELPIGEPLLSVLGNLLPHILFVPGEEKYLPVLLIFKHPYWRVSYLLLYVPYWASSPFEEKKRVNKVYILGELFPGYPSVEVVRGRECEVEPFFLCGIKIPNTVLDKYLVLPPSQYYQLLHTLQRLASQPTSSEELRTVSLSMPDFINIPQLSVEPHRSFLSICVGWIHVPDILEGSYFVRYRKAPFDYYVIGEWSSKSSPTSRPTLALVPTEGRLPILCGSTISGYQSKCRRSLSNILRTVLSLIGERPARREIPRRLIDMLLSGELPESVFRPVFRTLRSTRSCILISLPREYYSRYFPSTFLDEISNIERELKRKELFIINEEPILIPDVTGEEEFTDIESELDRESHEIAKEMINSNPFLSVTQEEMSRAGFSAASGVEGRGETASFAGVYIFLKPLGEGKKYSTYLISGVGHITYAIPGEENVWAGVRRAIDRLIRPSIAVVPKSVPVEETLLV